MTLSEQEKKEAREFKEKNKDTEFGKIRIEMDAEQYKFLDEQEVNSQYLDLGYVNDVWYYGFIVSGKDAIITSDKRILRNTEERFKDRIIGKNEIKELFDYEGYIGNIAPLINKQLIKQWVTYKLKIDKIKLFEQIRDKITYYMDFGNRDYIADVQTCWVIATYLYPLFYWFPHILFNAPSQSGKSKNAFILTQLSFRGFDLGASAGVTPAQIFRTLEGNRGTIFIDEFERRENRRMLC